MTYYVRNNLPSGLVLGKRRPIINEYFLSSYTLNIYAGCEFGCPYCDVWSYSSKPLNEVVRVPVDLPQRLAEELPRIHRGDLIGITSMSDPYQPAERTNRITRQVLQQFAEVGQSCLILTKGLGVLEDIPLLQRINEQSLAVVMMTLLTADAQLAERLEGKAPIPALRLDALTTLKRAGIPVGVVIAPILPYVNDTNYVLSRLFRACAEREVDFVVWDLLHIPDKNHYTRINEMIVRIGSYPASYYRDIYQNQNFPNKAYRDECHANVIDRCDQFNLAVRAPHRLFAGRLLPSNEAALFLKNIAFRDAAKGREHMANKHRDLANRIYQRKATLEQIQESPFAPTLLEILSGTIPPGSGAGAG